MKRESSPRQGQVGGENQVTEDDGADGGRRRNAVAGGVVGQGMVIHSS